MQSNVYFVTGSTMLSLVEEAEEERKGLLLEHFYSHWHLKGGAALPRPILEPRRVQSLITWRPG